MNSPDTTKTAQELIYLVSCSVNEQTPDRERCAQIDAEEVFALARSHSLTVAAALALEQAAELPRDFKEEKFKAVRVLSLYEIERKKILEELESRGIRYLPLKGITLGKLYPKSIMREMSDNDILCDSERMSDVREVMEQLGYECKSFARTHHDIYTKPPVLEFEMHRELFYGKKYPDQSAYYKNIWSRSVRDAGNRFAYHMTNEDLYVFLICHLRKHYKMSGTGLRSLLDIYLFNKKRGGSLNTGYVLAELKKLDLTDFESGVRSLAQKLFTGQPLSQGEQTELNFFVESTTHGTAENSLARQLDNDDSGRAKRKYVLKRIFPDSESLRRNHPVVYKHRVLYPFWALYRPVEGVLFKRKKMFGELKRLKGFKNKDNRGKFNE